MTGLIEVSGGIAELVAGDCGEIRDLDNWKDDRENCPGPFTKEECAAADKAARIARAAPELLDGCDPDTLDEAADYLSARRETAQIAKQLRELAEAQRAAIAKAEGAQ